MKRLPLFALILLLVPSLAVAQLSAATSSPFAISMALGGGQSLLPYFTGQWFDNNGNPVASGRVCTTVSGTTTNQATYPTYADAVALTNPNANPVVLDANGRGNIWLIPDVFYRITLYANGTGSTCNGAAVGTALKTVDGVAAAGSGGSGGTGCVGPGLTNFLTKWTSSTLCGASQILEDLGADFLKVRLGTALASDEFGEFWITTDSTGDTTPSASNEILFATKDGTALDEDFANIMATIASTSSMDTLDQHEFKIGNGSGDDRILAYTFNATTNAETLSLANDAINYTSTASAYQVLLNWDTSVTGDQGFRSYGVKVGNTTVPSLYSTEFLTGGTTYVKGGIAMINAGGNPLDPLPSPVSNSIYNTNPGCVGYAASPDNQCGLFVWNGDARISDPTDDYVQILAEPDFTTTMKWTAGGGFAFSGGKAVYSGAGGTITQAAADLVSPAQGNRYYSFSYTTSTVTGSPTCNLQSPGWDVYSGSPHLLDLTAGAHILDGTVGPAFYFRTAASAPTDFVLTCAGTGTVSLDTLFLSLSDGGSLTVDGKMTINDLRKTGAAATKKVVCVDTATGILYASSSDTACAN